MVITHPSHTIGKCFEDVCGIFDKQKIDASFRFELTVAKDKTVGFEIFGRTLPIGADRLNDDSRLSGGDVGAITFFTTHSNTFIFPPSLDDVKDVIPTSPVMFTDSVITMDQYRSMVVGTFPAIMMKLVLLKELDFLSACAYIKDPKAKSGNERRYSHVASILTKKNPQPALDKSSGTARISKFGPKYNLTKYCPVIPLFLLAFTGLHLASSSWGSYKTAWESYFEFVKHCGIGYFLPASADVLGRYVNYLKTWRKLRVSTIRSYLSAVKKLHTLNRLPSHQFHDDILLNYLKG